MAREGVTEKNVEAAGASPEEVAMTEASGPADGTEVAADDTTTEPVADEGPAKPAANGASVKSAALAPQDPSDPLGLPPHGTEVFVGGIPKTAAEADIRTFASKIGDVHSVKMSFDPSNPGQHRGYGFVRYLTKEAADEAKAKLHETRLEGTDSLLRVSNSQSKHRLYVGNIPHPWNKDQIADEVNKTSKGLESIELVPHKEIPGQNRGYAFLTFYNHECATAAKDALSGPSYRLDGRALSVSYAEPKSRDQDCGPVRSSAVYIGGLPPGVTEDKIKALFVKHGEVIKVVIPPARETRPEQRFCFVHFDASSVADKAVAAAEAGERPVLDDRVLEVKPARPQEHRLESRYFDANGSFVRRARGGRHPGPMTAGGRFASGGQGQPMGRGLPPGGYYPSPGYNQGYVYDQGYGGYEAGYGLGHEQGHVGYDQGYTGYDNYGGYVALQQPDPRQAGMTMVPMMLPSGQNEGQQGQAVYNRPERDYSNGRGRGRGPQRYRPY